MLNIYYYLYIKKVEEILSMINRYENIKKAQITSRDNQYTVLDKKLTEWDKQQPLYYKRENR